MASNRTPTILTIAGYDPYGGAGIVMDTKTIHALGGYALGAVTAITAQNSRGVAGVEAVRPETLSLQLETLLSDIRVDAVKIGMLANAEIIEVVAGAIRRHTLSPIVLDPVLISSSGRQLLDPRAIDAMITDLFPLATLITPNLDETNTLLGTTCRGTPSEIPRMAEGFWRLGAASVLFKGGHTAEADAVDTLVTSDERLPFSAPRIETSHTHGTGCVLSSAIATHLAHGTPLPDSVRRAKAFLHRRLLEAETLRLSYREEATRKEPVF